MITLWTRGSVGDFELRALRPRKQLRWSELKYNCALNAQVAQSVEQWTENPRVGGSIPPLGTIPISTS